MTPSRLLASIAITSLLVVGMLAAVACSKPGEEPLSEATTTSSAVKAISSCSSLRDRGTCSEYTSSSKNFSIEKSMCGSAHGDFSLTACPASGRIGVCEIGEGEAKRYYSAHFTAETAKADCEKSGQNARFLAAR
jgi:hypothetical protein